MAPPKGTHCLFCGNFFTTDDTEVEFCSLSCAKKSRNLMTDDERHLVAISNGFAAEVENLKITVAESAAVIESLLSVIFSNDYTTEQQNEITTNARKVLEKIRKVAQ